MPKYSITMFVAIAGLALLAAPIERALAQDQPLLTEFDAPGASSEFSPVCDAAFNGPGIIGCGTTPLANNDLGEVVGTYTDSGLVQHAFMRAPNGDITSFDAPGAGGGQGQGTVAFTINDAGVIAGGPSRTPTMCTTASCCSRTAPLSS